MQHSTTTAETDLAIRVAAGEFSAAGRVSDHVAESLRMVVGLLDAPCATGWSGPARDAFDRRVDLLRATVAAAAVLVDDANAEADRGVRGLGFHAG